MKLSVSISHKKANKTKVHRKTERMKITQKRNVFNKQLCACKIKNKNIHF
jgi:hypothetical protein